MSSLGILINKRKYMRKCISEAHNKRANLDALSPGDNATKKATFETWRKELKLIDDQILELQWGTWDSADQEVKVERELAAAASYDTKILECLTLLSTDGRPVAPDTNRARSLLKSPTAPLPSYRSGEEEDLVRFFEQFEEIISQFNYVDYDKFTLLKQQLSGKALTLIDSLDADKRSYGRAKTLLIEALASEDKQTFSIIQKVSEIKLTYGSDPFEYISKMKMLTERVNRLNLDAESFLRFFFWNGLNEQFQRQLIQITNHTKPTLLEINHHFFEAAERYNSLRKFSSQRPFERKSATDYEKPFMTHKTGEKKQVRPTEVCMATQVGYAKNGKSFKPCSLCLEEEQGEASHPIYQCSKYNCAREKADRLKALGGCSKCGGINHTTFSCKYRFNKPCFLCSGKHFSFLCLSKVGKDVDKKRKDGKGDKPKEASALNGETHTKLSITEALKGDFNGSSILPTFLVCINDELTVRGLKDGGCQSNLITTQLADKLNLKVIKDHITLTVNGINVPQSYPSKLVEMDITLGDETHKVTAFCLPTINMSMYLPDLNKVAKGFVERGYKLADPELIEGEDQIKNVEFILGNAHGYCLPEVEELLGNNSLISRTHMGILLKGDTRALLRNLYQLPSKEVPAVVTQTYSCLNSQDCNDAKEVYFEHKIRRYNILDSSGKIIESELDRATEDVLEQQGLIYNNVDRINYEEASTEINSGLVKFTLDNMTRREDGRLCVPLLWNSKVSHLLGKNYNLSKAILKSNLKKLQKNPVHMNMVDEVFKEQEKAGIIERIENLGQFLDEHPEHSFLPHMGVFKLNRETTKCRVVYLSNLCESDPDKTLTVSHNQAIHSGPCLNQKLSSALLHLRFGSQLLCFDLQKAFNTLALNEVDSNRLLCLWYRNVTKEDFTIVGYRNIRLSFGLRCSPTLLLLALYRILIIDTNEDSPRLYKLKRMIYALSYMDNCAVSADSGEDLLWAYDQLSGIFEPYQFELQQFCTNNLTLQEKVDSKEEKETLSHVKLLGLNWDRTHDKLSTLPIQLNSQANTKRSILSSIASQFDLYNFNGPILNRARFFMHTLQMQKELGWDDLLSEEEQKQWKNIAKQANGAPSIQISRFVGTRSESYRLIACSDSSKQAYGAVFYLQNMKTKELSFLLAKNRLIPKELARKSIPCLELKGVSFATECLIELYRELSGPACVLPVSIKELLVLTDSFVALSWIDSYTHKLDKMQKKSTFVLNRLNEIEKLCDTHPITFSFISGVENPADCITRSLSFKQLNRTNYLTGPSYISSYKSISTASDILAVTVPNPDMERENIPPPIETSCHLAFEVDDHRELVNRYSDFNKVVRTYRRLLIVVNNFKKLLKRKDPSKYCHIQIKPDTHNFYQEAGNLAIRKDQESYYPEVIQFLQSTRQTNKEMPNIISQLNVYLDSNGLLRVRSKLGKLQKDSRYNFPLLLFKHSPLTRLIIQEYHVRFFHAGCYALLSELRKQFWIPHYFSIVKKVLSSCVTCKRLNERAMKLNQSDYRDFRSNPPPVPFRTVFMDHLGPFYTKLHGNRTKVWLLCITCTWSRAINLKLCLDLSVKEFLRAFQLHCYEHGVPERCISDMGSQLVAGSNVIMDYLKDSEAKNYFEEIGIKPIKFEQFFKGCSQLGSMVEICVKLTKKLMFGAIKNNVLSYRDFEFIVCKTVHLVNRRPIAFKEALRDSELDVPSPITPEMLLRGYSLPSINLIPQLQGSPENVDPEWMPNTCPAMLVKENYHKLQKVRGNLIDVYHSEFLNNLVSQAVDVKDRYKPVRHKTVHKGDIVLLKETHSKPSQYPMGVIKDVTLNDLGEVTGALIMKGKNREVVKRHVTSLIPLLSIDQELEPMVSRPLDPSQNYPPETIQKGRQKRKAASAAKEKIKLWTQSS